MALLSHKRPLKPEDIADLVCYGDLQVSPDGKFLAYVRQSIKDDEYVTNIHVIEIATGRNVRLTNSGKDRSPRWSPDAKKIAFISERSSRSQIWVIGLDGGEAICAKTKEKVQSEPVWSPDGQRIYYLAGVFAKPADWLPYPGCPEEDRQRALEQAERRLSKDESSKEISEKKNLNDIRVVTRLRYRMDGIGYYDDIRTHIFYIDLDNSLCSGKELKSHQVTSGDFDYGLPSLSPDANYLVTSALCGDDADYHTKSDLWLVDISERKNYLLYDSPGPAWQPQWSEDGKYIAFFGHNNAKSVSTKTDLYLLPVGTFRKCLGEGTLPEPLCEDSVTNVTAATDLEAGSFISSDTTYGHGTSLSWDGSTLYFSAVDRGTPYIYCVDLPSGSGSALQMRVIAGSPEKSLSAFHTKKGVLAARWSTPEEPENLFLMEVRCSNKDIPTEIREKKVTFDNDDLVSQVALGKCDRFQYHGEDGQKLDAWLIHPPVEDLPSGSPSDQSLYPMVTLVHGGPHGAYGSAFMLRAQMFAGLGYYVCYFNPRGSSSYGQDFASCIDGDWGRKDYSDIMDGVKTVLGDYPVDKDNMFIHGWSYGGYMTTWIITQTNAFKAACAGAPVCNLYTDYGCTDIIWADEREYGGKPWEARDLYLDRSPVSHVENVETPILLVHGENDYRCRITHSEEFYQSLKRLGKTTVFVRYPDEYHGFKRPLHRVDLNKRILAWFEYYRKQG